MKQPRHAAGIVARVNESLAEYQRMRSWFLWPEADFPRTSTGKPKLAEIRASVEAQWGNGDGAGNWPATNGGIGELIARMQGGGNEVDPNANLDSDLRLSSLDRVELLGAIEDRYQVDLNETRFASARTVGELESLVRGSSPVSIRICVSPLGAALAGDVDSHILLLPADLARDAFDGSPARISGAKIYAA